MATVDPSIPAMAIDRESEREETLYEIINADWADDDPRWFELIAAYGLICSIRGRSWAANRRYQAAGEAVLDFFENLAAAFNVDGCTPDHRAELAICKEAADTIAKSLDAQLAEEER